MAHYTNVIEQLKPIIIHAGHIIMANYKEQPAIFIKEDHSPVTVADITANDYIISSLKALDPSLPIVSEEELNNDDLSEMSELWMIDPLDGTKEFIKGIDEFTVNIALIKDHKVTVGLIYAPAKELLYYAANGLGSWRQTLGQKPEKIEVANKLRKVPIALVSRSNLDTKTQVWLDARPQFSVQQMGSSLKFCYIADGSAEVYPKLTNIKEWDTAAADIILREAGGKIIQYDDLLEPSFNKRGFKQAAFIAFGPTILSREYIKFSKIS